jgi:cell division inhibitor SulA
VGGTTYGPWTLLSIISKILSTENVFPCHRLLLVHPCVTQDIARICKRLQLIQPDKKLTNKWERLLLSRVVHITVYLVFTGIQQSIQIIGDKANCRLDRRLSRTAS